MRTSIMEAPPASVLRLDESGAETLETAQTADPAWKPLYRIGGVAALISAALIPIAIAVFIVWPPPTTVLGYFTQFQNNKLIGLLNLDLVLVVSTLIAIPVFLALYVSLKRAGETFMTLALALAFVGMAAYFASNTAFNMLFLGDQYAAATTDAQRSQLLAAGQGMLAIYQGTAFHVNYVLGAVAGLIISVVMLRSAIFSKLTGYLGIVANISAFGLYVPVIGVFLSILSVLPLLVWDILVGRTLLRLSRTLVDR